MRASHGHVALTPQAVDASDQLGILEKRSIELDIKSLFEKIGIVGTALSRSVAKSGRGIVAQGHLSAARQHLTAQVPAPELQHQVGTKDGDDPCKSPMGEEKYLPPGRGPARISINWNEQRYNAQTPKKDMPMGTKS